MNPIEIVSELSGRIGPRPSCGESEGAAGAFILTRMREMGLEIEIQNFRATGTYSWAHLLCLLASLAAAAVCLLAADPSRIDLVMSGAIRRGEAGSAPLTASLVAAVLGTILLYFEYEARGFLSRLLAAGESHNVIGRPKTEPEKGAAIVLCAHHDTSRSALAFHPKLVGSIRATVFLTLFFSAAVAFSVAANWLFIYMAYERPLGLRLLPAACGVYLLFPIAVLLHRELCMKHTPGANDNASGIAALLLAAEKLLKDPLPNVRLWFVSTGAEESGLWGIRSFLLNNWEDLKGCHIINLDNVGRGDVYFVVEEGLLRPRRAGVALVRAAEKAAADKGFHSGRISFRDMPTDATAAITLGFPAMTLMAFEDGKLPDWHWKTDTADRVNEETVRQAANLAVEIVRNLSESR